MLVRCLYASRAAVPLTPGAIDAILETSQRNNVQRGITGLLCFSEQIFVQVLEGSRDDVSELYNAIVRDRRHAHIRLLSFREIKERRFGNWTMGQVNIAKINQGLLLKYAEKAALDPFSAPAHATMALLDELTGSAAILTRGN